LYRLAGSVAACGGRVGGDNSRRHRRRISRSRAGFALDKSHIVARAGLVRSGRHDLADDYCDCDRGDDYRVFSGAVHPALQTSIAGVLAGDGHSLCHQGK